MAQLSDAQNARLRAAMEAWLAENPGKKPTDLAKFIGRSQPAISEILRGKSGASMATAELFASRVGRPVYTIIGSNAAVGLAGSYERQTTAQASNDLDILVTAHLVLPKSLPGWRKAEDAARRLRPHLDWAIRGARTMPIAMPPKKVSATFVLRLARIFRDGATAEQKKRAVDEELEERDQEEPVQVLPNRQSDTVAAMPIKKA